MDKKTHKGFTTTSEKPDGYLHTSASSAVGANPASLKEAAGFTLIELLVVIAIISLLSSVVLSSLSNARASARDARRASDFGQFRTAMELFYNDNGEYAGGNYQDGMVSQSCTGNDLYQDLVDGGYLQQMPTDPVEDFVDCNDSATAGTEELFYGWDGQNNGGDACFVINNFETSDDGGSLSNINQAGTQPYGPSFGSQGNVTQAEFVYCFADPNHF